MDLLANGDLLHPFSRILEHAARARGCSLALNCRSIMHQQTRLPVGGVWDVFVRREFSFALTSQAQIQKLLWAVGHHHLPPSAIARIIPPPTPVLRTIVTLIMAPSESESGEALSCVREASQSTKKDRMNSSLSTRVTAVKRDRFEGDRCRMQPALCITLARY